MQRRTENAFPAFVLVGFLALLWLAALTMLFGQQRANTKLQSAMSDYHLASAAAAAEARQASTAILALSRAGPAAPASQPAPLAPSALDAIAPAATSRERALTDHVGRLTDIVKDLRSRHAAFGTVVPSPALRSFATAVATVQAQLPTGDALAAAALPTPFLQQVERLELRGEQLFRFHMANYDLAASQLAEQGRRNRWIQGGMLAAIAAHGLLALALVLRHVHRADTALRRGERQYRNILDNMIDTYYRTDVEGRITMVSPSAASLLGWPVEQLIGRRIEEFYAEADGAARFQRAMSAGHGAVRNYETPLRGRDGDTVWVSGSARVVYDDNGNAADVEGIVRNITEQHAAEAALRDSQARIAAIMDMAPEAIISLDAAQRVVMFNRGAEDIFGYSAEEILGQTLDCLLPPAARRSHGEHIREFAVDRDENRPMGQQREVTGVRKNGEEFPAEAAISKIELAGEIVFTVMLRDITDRKHAEVAARRALQQAEAANAARSEFLATMSHELRTPLNAVIGFAQILSKEIMGPLGNDSYREYVQDIEHSGQHLLAIINDILDLARVDSGHVELQESAVNLMNLLASCHRMVSRQAHDKRLDFTILDALPAPVLWADQQLLKQTVLNLFSNAVKFTPADGRIAVWVEATDEGGLAINVRDSGIGMTPDAIKVAFEPFTQVDGSLARQYGGTGLGLPLSKSFAELHGGTIEIASSPGEGTTVSLRLPPDRVLPADQEVKANRAC